MTPLAFARLPTAIGELPAHGVLPAASGTLGSSWPLPTMGGPAEALLILLVAGHLVGDFALQSERMAEGKRRGGMLVGHVLVLALAHLGALAPLLSWRLVVLVLAIALAHGTIDLFKTRWRRGRPGPLKLFLLDQVAHLVVLYAAWALFIGRVGTPEAHLSEPALATFLAAAVLIAAFAFNATGGGAVVSGVLAAHDPTLEEEGGRKSEAGSDDADVLGRERTRAAWGEVAPEDQGIEGSGRLIGILERTLSLILILAGQWAAIVILIAAKSIARFDELKERRFSEYYLIGTLTSLLVVVVTGFVLMGVLARL